ncbi:MAG: PqqD family protein [Bacteroidales bacterium]|jgi:hypothetical protein
MLNHSYQLAHPDIVFERFDEDLVVLNLRSGQYFGFNNAGTLIWNALSSGVKASTIIEAGVKADSLETFLSALIAHELLIEAASVQTALDGALATLLAQTLEIPSIEIYDDLADLIMADPIHDVDADAGWPMLPVSK